VAQVFFAGLVVPFTVSTCDSVLRGAGNVRTPAICSTLSIVLQILLTPVFMFSLGWGIRGAPAATVAGQLIGVVPRLPFLFGRRAALRLRFVPHSLRGEPLAEILRVGIPASLGTLINYLGAVALTAVMARLGTAELAAYGLGSRFDFVMLTIAYGTGVAVLTLVGFAAGANKPELASGFARRGAFLMMAVLAPPAALLWLWPGLWLGLFTEDPAVHAAGSLYFRVLAITYPLMGMSMTLAFAFQGVGRALVPLMIGIARVIAIVVGASLLMLGFDAGMRGVLFLVAATSVASSAVLASIFFRSSYLAASERVSDVTG
jgi:putative MATE family efflux protein